MKKQKGKKWPIKNVFTYPSGKQEVVMAKTRLHQDKIEEDMRRIQKDTDVKIKHQKFFPQ